jgi:hypothetical protein
LIDCLLFRKNKGQLAYEATASAKLAFGIVVLPVSRTGPV